MRSGFHSSAKFPTLLPHRKVLSSNGPIGKSGLRPHMCLQLENRQHPLSSANSSSTVTITILAKALCKRGHFNFNEFAAYHCFPQFTQIGVANWQPVNTGSCYMGKWRGKHSFKFHCCSLVLVKIIGRHVSLVTVYLYQPPISVAVQVM